MSECFEVKDTEVSNAVYLLLTYIKQGGEDGDDVKAEC